MKFEIWLETFTRKVGNVIPLHDEWKYLSAYRAGYDEGYQSGIALGYQEALKKLNTQNTNEKAMIQGKEEIRSRDKEK